MDLLIRRKDKSESGQAIVLIAFAFIGLIAFIGLAVDVGLFYIGYGHLRRAADAAALGAASLYRQDFPDEAHLYAALDSSAKEYLRMNEIDLDNASATVYTCNGGGPVLADGSLCPTGTNPPRKQVKVVAKGNVKTAFLGVLGFYDLPIQAESVCEAASLDVVLVIDISESMTYDCQGDGNCPDEHGTQLTFPDFKDMSICNQTDASRDGPSGDNTPGECHPFEEVKLAAKTLATKILGRPGADGEDRLSIVYFSNGWQDGINQGTQNQIQQYEIRQTPPVISDGWTSSLATATAAINDLKVYDPGNPCRWPGNLQNWANWQVGDPISDRPPAGDCRRYDTNPSNLDKFMGTDCPTMRNAHPPFNNDISTCETTNIGGGLRLGAYQFTQSSRPESVWVEIMLTDGVPNATCDDDAKPTQPQCHRNLDDVSVAGVLPIKYCPHGDFATNSTPYCIGHDVTVQHHISGAGSDQFDPMDYARLAGLYAGCDAISPQGACGVHSGVVPGAVKGQGAELFTIGLGADNMSKADDHGRLYGPSLLRWIANFSDYAYDGLGNLVAASDSCNGKNATESCGRYYYAASGSELDAIFTNIASRMFTRISQ